MTLVLQIAGGIVLGVLVLRFPKAVLGLLLALLGLGVLLVLGLWMFGSKSGREFLPIGGVILVTSIFRGLRGDRQIPKDQRLGKPD